jgi:membrane protease YdiL (CAAX protease family)
VVLLICELVFLLSGNYNELIILASVVVILIMTRFVPPKLPSENPLANQSRSTLRAPLWPIVGVLFVYGLVLVLVAFWVHAQPLAILPSLTFSHDLTWNALAGDLAFFVVPTLLLTLRYGGTGQQLGLTHITRARWIGAMVPTLLLLALQIIGSGIRPLPIPAVAYTGVFSVIGIGFPEEFLFRVLLQTRLEVLFGRWNGLLATTVVFTLGHMPGRVVSMWGKTGSPLLDILLVFAGVVTIQGPLALVLGYMWMRYRNAWLNVGAHALFDWFGYLTT